MYEFFQAMGRSVLQQWSRENFSLESFPAIAQAVLDASPPSDLVDVSEFQREFLLRDEQAAQSHSGFGQPELIAFHHPKFYIQILYWLDGTTDIHQHEFSGAFHVMAGSSIHALYTFEQPKRVTPHFRMGQVKMQSIELLETGRTVPIVSGQHCIHSLFHLDTPSITVVVRTQNDPGTGPQFNYLPPCVAYDPVYDDALTQRRKQLLDVLAQTGDPAHLGLVMEMIATLDFERGFFILQHSMSYLQFIGAWAEGVQAFEARHGALANGVEETLQQCFQRDVIKGFRASVTEVHHRFFLALLLNVPSRKALLALVDQRYPDQPALETILEWLEELAEESEEECRLLDAVFPEGIDVPPESRLPLFLGCMKVLFSGAKRRPASLKELSSDDFDEIHAAVAASSLRGLIAT